LTTVNGVNVAYTSENSYKEN